MNDLKSAESEKTSMQPANENTKLTADPNGMAGTVANELRTNDKTVLRNFYRNEFKDLQLFMPPKEFDALIDRYVNNPLDYSYFNAGKIAGIGEGLIIGAKKAIVGIYDLVMLLVKLEIEYLKFVGKTISKIPETLGQGLEFLKDHLTNLDSAAKKDFDILKNIGIIP